jgi:hypothetical protein
MDLNKLFLLIIVFNGVWLTVRPYMTMPSASPMMKALEEGFKPDMSDTEYLEFLEETAMCSGPERKSLFESKYGVENLSGFMLTLECYEKRVFTCDTFQRGMVDGKFIFDDTGHLRHFCEISDITNIETIYEEPGGSLKLIKFTATREDVYSVKCHAVFRIFPDSMRLEYLGVANRLSDDIFMSRPVFFRSDSWMKYANEIYEKIRIKDTDENTEMIVPAAIWQRN